MPILVATPNPGIVQNGSEMDPYSLTQAISKAQPGDTVLCRGVFLERLLITREYQPDAPLTISAHPDGAIFDGKFALPKHPVTGPAKTAPDGTTANHSGLVQLIAAKHVKLSGLAVVNSLGRGINLDRAQGIEIDQCSVDWSRNSGIYADLCADLKILRSRVEHSGCYYQKMRSPNQYNWPGGVSVLRSAGIMVGGCLVGRNWGEGIIVWRGSHGAEVSDCTIADNMSVNLYGDRAVDTQFLRNLIYCTGTVPDVPPAQGITVRNETYPDTTPPASNLLIANNLIINCAAGILIGASELAGELVTGIGILSNTLVNSRDAQILIRTRDARNVTIIGNVFSGSAQAIKLDPQTDQYLIERNIEDAPLVNAGADLVYGQVDRANYQIVVEPPIIIDPPIPPALNELVTLLLEAEMPAADAAKLRQILSGRAVNVRLG